MELIKDMKVIFKDEGVMYVGVINNVSDASGKVALLCAGSLCVVDRDDIVEVVEESVVLLKTKRSSQSGFLYYRIRDNKTGRVGEVKSWRIDEV